jgi:murein L,D-transpeptidase YafK
MLATKQAKIVIKKMARRLVFSTTDGRERVYAVALGRNWAADKAIEGDHATPLGEFYVCAKNPRSKYLRSLCISYPNAEDAERGLAAGLITAAEHAQIIEAIDLGKVPPQHTRLGGEIYIHGQPDGRSADAAKDWTRGCVALDDVDMWELYDLVAIGTRVVIVD